MAKVRPLHDRLLVKRIEEKETVKGGIIIPDTAKEKPQEGEVIAVGNGKILDNGTKVPLDVKASTSRPATRSSSASTPAPTSRSTTRSS